MSLRAWLIAIAFVACSTAPPAQASPNATDEQLVRDLLAFARTPGPATAARVPFAPQVGLGLGDQIRVTRAQTELVSPAAWVLNIDLFRGRTGTASALDLLSEGSPTVISIGPHPHCASPPVPPPTGLAGARRISVQRTGVDTCLLWWTVDIFVSASGQVDAITLDLWEP